MKRRHFIRAGSLAAISLKFPQIGNLPSGARRISNKFPKWKGFNLLDFFVPNPVFTRYQTSEDHFKWMQEWGFDFIRVPIAYPWYLRIDRTKDIRPEQVYDIDEASVEKIESLVHLANKYGLHASINLHRAPGYCINAGFHEPFNLWKDQSAQDAFYFHWNLWAKRFRSLSQNQISFDLVNEPSMREDMNDQHSKSGPVPGDIYRKVAKSAAEAIRKENPDHLVIADGNNVGNSVIPEIRDLNIGQSCRGYYPGAISHYRAPWANKDPEHMPEPAWPGTVGNKEFNRQMLLDYYKPWFDLTGQGIGVHCGECGCWNKTPHKVFLSWFGDVLEILATGQIGFALWNFIGDFGVIDSGRLDVDYEDWQGHKLDRKLLDLLRNV